MEDLIRWGNGGLLLSLAVPVWLLFTHNRATTLRSTTLWAMAAWLAHVKAAVLGGVFWSYLALSLTGATGIAVLGARRPGEGAWNFVVGGLLLIFLWPFVEGWGEPRLGLAHLGFLSVVLLITLLNYLPTRIGWGALLIGVGCWIEIYFHHRGYSLAIPSGIPIACGGWLSYVLLRARNPENEVNALWLDYRDRFGTLWAHRAREQFNQAAANQGLTLRLAWQGVEGPESEHEQAVLILRGLWKRFRKAESV